MATSDHDLIRRFQAGDPEAFIRLVRRWDGNVLNLAYRMTGQRHDAEDIRQQVFLRVHRGLAKFAGEAVFSTWLYRVVLNTVRDSARSRRSRTRALDGLRGRSAVVSQESAEDQELRREDIARVAASVRALPPAEREVIVLRHYHDLTFAQVSEILETPVTTVKSRALRALEHLRELLKETQPRGSTEEHS